MMTRFTDKCANAYQVFKYFRHNKRIIRLSEYCRHWHALLIIDLSKTTITFPNDTLLLIGITKATSNDYFNKRTRLYFFHYNAFISATPDSLRLAYTWQFVMVFDNNEIFSVLRSKGNIWIIDLLTWAFLYSHHLWMVFSCRCGEVILG